MRATVLIMGLTLLALPTVAQPLPSQPLPLLTPRPTNLQPENAQPGMLQIGVTLPTGMKITPQAAPGSVLQPLNPGLAAMPDYLADSAVAMALSPNHQALLVLTSGYNRTTDATGRRIAELSGEYVFVYDITGETPIRRQVVGLPNSFIGLAWAPDGKSFFASGGVDDSISRFVWAENRFVPGFTTQLAHKAGVGVGVKPVAGGIGISPDGMRLLVANYANDSVTMLDATTGALLAERDLRPGRIDPRDAGQPGGTYPWTVAWTSANRAYVSIQRDRELVTLSATANTIAVTGRIRLRGQPNQMLANAAGTRLYVALDNSDSVAAIDTATNAVLADISATAPSEILPNPAGLRGANPNALALSPDERTLFVSLGGLNAISVIQIDSDVLPPANATPALKDDDDDAPPAKKPSRVIGLIPTGWYPNAVALGDSGRTLYVANGKFPAGPNPSGCRASASCQGANQFVLQLEKAGLLSMPLPDHATLARLTRQVAQNNNFPTVSNLASHDTVMQALRSRIRHVIYVIKENRTYDQVLGDLETGNGDPKLALFPNAIGPNHHALARNFVTLDNFYDSGAVSPTGWNWSTAARTTDMTEKTVPLNYAQRGMTYDWEGMNRNINVALPTLAARIAADSRVPNDPDIVPGTADVAAPDAAGGEPGAGYIWDLAIRAGLTVRNYGFYGDLSRYFPGNPKRIPLERDPAAAGLAVFFPTKEKLADRTDLHFRGYDMDFPDFWRIREWQREFAIADAEGTVPSLTLMRLPHDHFGNFTTAIDGVNTVETQFADNDYALGLLVETVAKSKVADSTLIFVLEDDAQNGPDHVDAHRSPAFIIGPYVKQYALVSTHHTTVSMLRTIEEILNLPPMGLNDGLAEPMSDVFDLTQTRWTYRAIVPEILRTTQLPLPARSASLDGPTCPGLRTRTSAYWTKVSRGQNFDVEDHLNVDTFNRALWTGRMGFWAPYPTRDGIDRRENRQPQTCR
jgi:YVTN family beta-propeller protein